MMRPIVAATLLAAVLVPTPSPRPALAAGPDDTAAERMVKETLLLWNEANRHGDYRRFYRTLHPAFQATTSPRRLAAAYGPFREKRLDFSTIAGMRPVLRRRNAGAADLAGVFDTRPQQLHFRLIFAPSRGAMKLYAIDVELAPPA